MQRWAKNRLKIVSFQGSVCPKILTGLEKEANQTQYWIPKLDDNIDTYFKNLLCYLLNMSNQFHHHNSSIDHLFEVRHASNIGEKFVVNLDIHECSCQKWMLTRIPCCHALSATKFVNVVPCQLHFILVQEGSICRGVQLNYLSSEW